MLSKELLHCEENSAKLTKETFSWHNNEIPFIKTKKKLYELFGFFLKTIFTNKNLLIL